MVTILCCLKAQTYLLLLGVVGFKGVTEGSWKVPIANKAKSLGIESYTTGYSILLWNTHSHWIFITAAIVNTLDFIL